MIKIFLFSFVLILFSRSARAEEICAYVDTQGIIKTVKSASLIPEQFKHLAK